MKRLNLVSMSLVLGIIFSVVICTFSYAEDEGTKSIQGNVICLIPDYAHGTVKPVIATHPCDGLPTHQHVLVTEDTVYSLQGLQDGLRKIEQNPNRTDVVIAGKVKGSEQTGWVLFVN